VGRFGSDGVFGAFGGLLAGAIAPTARADMATDVAQVDGIVGHDRITDYASTEREGTDPEVH
jgi:hypothetical protein